MTIYKIRDAKTGLFCSGGMNPTFDKKGKYWNKLSHVKCFLNHHTRSWQCGAKRTAVPSTWEIVEYGLIETKSYYCNNLTKNKNE